ncbi:MAG: flagellar type III secretion system pore protein FliP [Clostridiaceae bacterium]|nr:flagellar type III secretion system pore protein FliP [Eubacteriales bacterium]
MMNELRARLYVEKNKRAIKKTLVILLALLTLFVFAGCSVLADNGGDTAGVEQEEGPFGGILGNRSESVEILLMLTVLTLLPSILIMLTCFTRIVIVLSLVRNGLGMQQMPPNQVLIGLALFVTLFIMTPTIDTIKETAYEPYVDGRITQEEAADRAMAPIRTFMLAQTYESDLKFFMSAAGQDAPVDDLSEIKNTTLIPAYITSEIKHGFEIGFFLYVPFIVIDMVVASTLMAMGMMMLPPTVISLPFKLLLFVMVDGWTLTVKTLITSFN